VISFSFSASADGSGRLSACGFAKGSPEGILLLGSTMGVTTADSLISSAQDMLCQYLWTPAALRMLLPKFCTNKSIIAVHVHGPGNET